MLLCWFLLNVKEHKTQEWWVDVTHQVGGRIRAEEGLKADVRGAGERAGGTSRRQDVLLARLHKQLHVRGDVRSRHAGPLSLPHSPVAKPHVRAFMPPGITWLTGNSAPVTAVDMAYEFQFMLVPTSLYALKVRRLPPPAGRWFKTQCWSSALGPPRHVFYLAWHSAWWKLITNL